MDCNFVRPLRPPLPFLTMPAVLPPGAPTAPPAAGCTAAPTPAAALAALTSMWSGSVRFGGLEDQPSSFSLPESVSERSEAWSSAAAAAAAAAAASWSEIMVACIGLLLPLLGEEETSERLALPGLRGDAEGLLLLLVVDCADGDGSALYGSSVGGEELRKSVMRVRIRSARLDGDEDGGGGGEWQPASSTGGGGLAVAVRVRTPA